jgi:hypothetical protein
LHLHNHTSNDTLDGQTQRYLLDILKWGKVTQASIDGLYEFPDCHAFAETVAAANASTGSISTVSLTADNFVRQPFSVIFSSDDDKLEVVHFQQLAAMHFQQEKDRGFLARIRKGQHIVLPSEGWAAGLCVDTLGTEQALELALREKRRRAQAAPTIQGPGRSSEVALPIVGTAKILGAEDLNKPDLKSDHWASIVRRRKRKTGRRVKKFKKTDTPPRQNGGISQRTRQALNPTTSCRCSPRPSIPSVITSPFLR